MKESEFKNMFLEHIKEHHEFEEKLSELEKLLNIDGIYESFLVDTYYYSFDRVTNLMFNVEGQDWFNWYMFEKPENNDTLIFNNMTVLIDTDERFYDFIKQFSNFKFDENNTNNEGC